MDIKHYDPIKALKDLSEILETINKYHVKEYAQVHLRFWFRGHSKKIWELQPSVYREEFKVADEEERLNKERHLFQDFKVQSAGLRSGISNNVDLYFLQQHYRMPTRLLDWTNSPLVALYFAVVSDYEDDGALFFMDVHKLSIQQKAVYEPTSDGVIKKFRGIATGGNNLLKKAIEIITSWDNEADFPQFIIPARPNYFDKRISLQRSCFTFHVPKNGETLTEKQNPTLAKILIPKDAKPRLRRELALLGIDAFSIFGDLDGLSQMIKSNYL